MTNIGAELAILSDLVAIPSIPGKCNAEWLGYARARLEAVGCRTTVVPAPDGECDGLIASIGPELPGGLVLSGHADVVSVEGQAWSGDPFRLRREGSRLIGRGAVDMKGFLACAIALMEEAGRMGVARPLHLAISADEESTCHSAISLAAHLEHAVPRPRGVLVGEPTLLRPVNRHKGSYTIEVDVTGKPAHASMPELGVSATAIAARLIAWLDDRSARNSAPDATTHSVGRIAGGAASNIIAGHCRFEWDIRLAPQETLDAVLQAFQLEADRLLAPFRSRAPDVRVGLTQTAAFPGFQTAPESPFAEACLAASDATEHGAVPAGTEAGIYQAAGLPVIVMGPGDMAQAHMPDEYIEVDQLAGCAAQLRRLI